MIHEDPTEASCVSFTPIALLLSLSVDVVNIAYCSLLDFLCHLVGLMNKGAVSRAIGPQQTLLSYRDIIGQS